MMRYKTPNIPASELTPDRVRDEVKVCVKYVMEELLPVFGQNLSRQELETYADNTLRQAFKGCGEEFERPTRNGLMGAIDNCRTGVSQMASSLPNDLKERVGEIVAYHYKEMRSLIERLNE